jgi:hypothetical protein
VIGDEFSSIRSAWKTRSETLLTAAGDLSKDFGSAERTEDGTLLTAAGQYDTTMATASHTFELARAAAQRDLDQGGEQSDYAATIEEATDALNESREQAQETYDIAQDRAENQNRVDRARANLDFVLTEVDIEVSLDRGVVQRKQTSQMHRSFCEGRNEIRPKFLRLIYGEQRRKGYPTAHRLELVQEAAPEFFNSVDAGGRRPHNAGAL